METYEEIYKTIRHNWDAIAKPLDSLGKLEDLVARLGAVQGKTKPALEKTAALILCGDNGIVEEGISQSPQEVTAICAVNIAQGKTVAGVMASRTGSDIIAVDMGVASAEPLPYVLNRKIRQGTRNFLKEPAMTPDEVKAAVDTGMNLMKECRDKGYDAVCIGEMGIGNTTTSAAVAATLLGLPAVQVAGRGAGLSDAGLRRKVLVIQQAIDKYSLYEAAPLETVRTVGGFDIAGMVGVYMGARKYGIPVILDGAISMTAALAAEMMDPGVKDYLLPSHKSREPLSALVADRLGVDPVLDAGMALGEGTGALLMLGVLQTALEVYCKSVPFADSGVGQYTRFDPS